MTIGQKSQDFLHIEKCFASLKAKEDIKGNLTKISTILKRSFDLTFNISIIENDTNQFFGMNIYPDQHIVSDMVDSILREKSHTSTIVELWQKDSTWYLEIDSILLYDKNLNANPTEITAVLLHEIGHIIFSNSIPQRVNKIMRYEIMKMNYSIKKLCENYKIRKLFNLVFIDACATKNFHYINTKSERTADAFVVRMGYGNELDNFINKLIATHSNKLINRTESELDSEVKTIVNWAIVNANELEFRKSKLKQSIQTELLKNPSIYVRGIFQSIKQAFFGGKGDSYTSILTEQYLVDMKQKIVKESILDWFDSIGKVKKINQSDIDVISVEMDKISNNDDRIYVLDRVYDKLDLVNTSLEFISKGQSDRVVQSKQTLSNIKNQLEKMRNNILHMQLKDKQYGVFIKYPKGYEG